MFFKILLALMHHIPWLKRRVWNRMYQRFADVDAADWTFMNYGYSPAEGETRLELSPEDEPNRYAIQLYHRLASVVPLAGKDVLEVGSGRGGGSEFMARNFAPASMTGVDFSAKAVQRCSERFKRDGLVYKHGDAEALPFEAGSFDVVINAESSHCYGSMPKFLSEVRRVLRHGGSFSFADVRWYGHCKALHAQMIASGLELVEHEEITPRVFESLTRDSDRKLRIVEGMKGASVQAFFTRLWGLKGSETYESFRTGKLLYMRYLMKK